MGPAWSPGAEARRLEENARREKNWERWGPYLSERQWGTVREDYSPDGECWGYFPHDHARSRAYRWGEDGLLGITDREGRLCFALALWNGRDPILKERLFGLTGPEGNHGEDVKECYFYLDATPTYSYFLGLYKYPQAEFPYAALVEENRRRGRGDPEFDLPDTGVFEGGRYFDVFAEYAKAAPDDLRIRITVANRGPEAAPLHLLPTLWFRNTWSWGRSGEGYWPKPRIVRDAGGSLIAAHESLGRFRWAAEAGPDGAPPEFLFTENETNHARLFRAQNRIPYAKDAFHEAIVRGNAEAVNPNGEGTKAAAVYRLTIPARGEVRVRLRLGPDTGASAVPSWAESDAVIEARRREADEFYAARIPAELDPPARRAARQAYAGLLWSKQFYHYVARDWREGDPGHLPPPPERAEGRNRDWGHLYARDVLSMPDKWEYPWFAAWDLAFHALPLARVDPDFAKSQLILLLREWYMHPSGQLAAYEFNFGDVNPPVHAWACWRVYKIAGPRGGRDRAFLERAFHKLLFNFTWWVNRKDADGNHIFSGGFLGLDNIGLFDRSKPLPGGGQLEQADGTAWAAFFCATMLSMALELAREDPVYEDLASKFFEHFIAIADAMNCLGGSGLWDDRDGFYYDHLSFGGRSHPLRIRSVVGIIPLFAVSILSEEVTRGLPGFRKRMDWFLENRKDLADCICLGRRDEETECARRLLAIPSRERLVRVLRYVLDEGELLSPFGVRSLSRAHLDPPYSMRVEGEEYRVKYVPGDSDSGLFGGNSNWRGPVWFPLNYLLVEALERYHLFYGDALQVECPTGSGRKMSLGGVAEELTRRLTGLYRPDAQGRIPALGEDRRWVDDPHWRELLLFHEYFHGDTGKGLGASHQTGWTSLLVRWLEDEARRRAGCR